MNIEINVLKPKYLLKILKKNLVVHLYTVQCT
jgi:hypothetical protein